MTRRTKRFAALLILAVFGLPAVLGISTLLRKSTPAAASDAMVPSAPALARPAAVWPFIGNDKPAAADPRQYLTKNYYFVLDASGSMAERRCSGNESKMTVAKQALNKFVALIPADANVGGMVFDEGGVRELAPLAPKDEQRVGRAIDAVRAGGGTPLADAMQLAYDALTQRAARQLGYGEYHLIVVTDGEASRGQDPRQVVDQMAEQSPVVLHTVGFCIGDAHSLNQPGRAIYRAADSQQDLESGLADVLAEAPSFDVASFNGKELKK